MAYKLVCTREFHDHHSGRLIKRGEMIDDYDHMAKLYHGHEGHISRRRQFVKVHLPMEPDQWEWPPLKEGRPKKDGK